MTPDEQAPGRDKGLILRIQRMSTEDGPGIRSTIFFKGCPLRCVWCHNPESISARPQVHWVGTRCIGCMSCIEVCPNKALTRTASGITVNRRVCTGCLSCAGVCPSTAMEVYGEYYDAQDLVREVLKDRVFFEKSGGGVSLSGGEPTLQSGFANEVLGALKEQGIHTALDTCGQCPWERLEELLAHTDLLLYDLKLMDEDLHRHYTGQGLDRILENLARAGRYCRADSRRIEIWIRTPVIPLHTDLEENIRAVGSFIRDTMNGAVARWELCAFNNLCIHKYEGLGVNWKCKEYSLMTDQDMERLAQVARTALGRGGIVHTSGPTRSAGETRIRPVHGRPPEGPCLEVKEEG